LASKAGSFCDVRGVSNMTAIVFVFLPSLYAVIERLQYALVWFGVLIAMNLWVGRIKGTQRCTDFWRTLLHQ
jgi:hypothetical protein